ncbi:uncharacterized protein LOC119452870 [Dermacentor silvarum]|uniref:uncharacterized protein LOC119452870 n=1 Tax=Dermacentor silvarum TaxID=543639 RepID=UPI002101056C|nr:uncharacterized protein LOC119452870 [Dermacentor silvarum]
MQTPCTVQGVRHKMVVSRGTGRSLMIHSSEEPSAPGAEAAASMIRQFVECDAVASSHIHPRDTLPCLLTMLNYTKAECNSDTDNAATAFRGYTRVGILLPRTARSVTRHRWKCT